MCTITWVPKGESGFLAGVNRDESPKRKRALPPREFKAGNTNVTAPVDSEAGGTWVGISEQGRFMALMNGAFAPHKKQLPYRKSRGLIVLDNFSFKSAPDFLNNAFLFGIEPFTAVLADTKPALRLFELRWDGAAKYAYEIRSDIPHIWSSENLFTSAMHMKRERWFSVWCRENNKPEVANLRDFHLNGGKKEGATGRERICMTIEDRVCSVSNTIIENTDAGIQMHYEDFL